jgi:hypothetical protein
MPDPSDAVKAAVAALVAETKGDAPPAKADASAAAAPAEQQAQTGEPKAQAAAEQEPEKPEKPSEPDEVLRELRAFSQAQERWGRRERELASKAAAAKDESKREILAALSSSDPDGELERLGVSQADRRMLVQRMVLRHVPKDKADPDLQRRIEMDALEQRAVRAEKKVDEFIAKQQEDRERERQEQATRQQAAHAISTLHGAFRSAGDDLKAVKSSYGADPDATLRDAIQIGKELAAKGTFARMSEADVARRIAKELDARYRRRYGLDAGTSSSAAAAPTQQAQTTGQKDKPKNAAEVSAARTISRGATEVTRPPPSQEESSLDEDAFVAAKAAEFARLRREGKFARS